MIAGRPALTALLLAATLFAPLAARAQTNEYEEPKVKLGKGDPSIAVAGKGTVVVQMFVKADGGATFARVIRSTNPGDNDAAIAIAKSSKYTPAMRAGKPVDAYKDFTINFTGSGTAASGDAEGGGTGETARIEQMLRAGNYAGARDAATAYVSAHPDSVQGYAQLGAANTLLNDNTAAAAAFDKAGKIPEAFVPLAAQAYMGNSAALGRADNGPQAVVYAKKAVALQPSAATYNGLGVQELGANDSAAAVSDLEQAGKLASADPKTPANVRATILSNLAAAYAANGQMDKAKATIAQANQLDPKVDAGAGVAGVLIRQAKSLESQKKLSEAGAVYEQAAEFSQPADASSLYLRAAQSYLNALPKPEAEKALGAAQKSLAAKPNNAAGNFLRGIALADLGRSSEAKDTLSAALVQAKAENQTDLQANIEAALIKLGVNK